MTYVGNSLAHLEIKKSNAATLASLKGCASRDMVRKIAGSGLTFAHIKIVFRRNGQQGIADLLSETDKSGKVRVTRSHKNYFKTVVSKKVLYKSVISDIHYETDYSKKRYD